MYLKRHTNGGWDRLRYIGSGRYTRRGDPDPNWKISPTFSVDLRTLSNYWYIYICPTVQLLLDDSAQVYNELSDKNSNRS